MGVRSIRQAKQRLIDMIKITKSKYNYDSLKGYQGTNDPLAKDLEIIVEEHQMHFDYGAYIAADPPVRPYAKILLDPFSIDREHLNFSYYHEISHHLIRNDSELYGFLSDLATDNDDFDTLVDRLANSGAAEFLIPSDDLLALQRVRGFSIRLLPELDQSYPASKPAIAIQMAQCASHGCFVIVCQFGFPPINNKEAERLMRIDFDDEPKLFVQYTSASPTQEYWIGKNSVIPKNHLLYRAYETQDYVAGRDFIPFRNGRNDWTVECEALSYKGKVYAVFNVTKPALPSPQASLFDTF